MVLAVTADRVSLQWISWCPATGELSGAEPLYHLLGIDDAGTRTLATLLSRVHPEDAAPLRAGLEQAGRGAGAIAVEFRLFATDRCVSHIQLAARGVCDSRGRPGVIGVVQDVSAQRECEQALAQAQADLAYAARVMSLGSLSASIAHEIKQPLSGIITNASTCLRMLAADPPDFAGARETARRTLRDGNRASDVITRLRALFTRKTADDETANLNELVQEALALAYGDLQCRRIAIGTQLTEELPCVRGDRIQLYQVVLNLVLNAADAMDSIEERPRRLMIRTEWEGVERVRLSLEDTGTGFAAHEARLFEPFFTTKSGGMGIGLAVSRTIIDRHGGRLWAMANEGPGATFCFCLPCECPSLPDPGFVPRDRARTLSLEQR